MKRETVQITNWIWQIKSEQNGIKFVCVLVCTVIRFYSLLLFSVLNCSSSLDASGS